MKWLKTQSVPRLRMRGLQVGSHTRLRHGWPGHFCAGLWAVRLCFSWLAFHLPVRSLTWLPRSLSSNWAMEQAALRGCYFGAFFAFASALNYATSFFAPIYHWELDPKILGFEWAVLGIVLILTTPIFARYAPAAATISVVGADVGIAALSLIYFGYNSSFMLQLSGWAFFVAGLFGIVMAAGGILASAGMAFPMGKPLFKHAA